MRKDTESVSDIFVKKVVEKWQKLFTKEEIITLWTRSGGSKSRVSYAVSLLLGRKILTRIARDIYIGADESIESLYWEIIRSLIGIHSPSGAIVWWEKALELHMMNYSLPDTIILYTRATSTRITLSDGRGVHFRTLASGKKTKMKNLYPILAKYASHLDSIWLLVPKKEVALLESLSLREHDSGVAEANVMRFLTKNHSLLESDIFIEILKYRYIRAVNRLREIAKNEGYDDLYRAMIDTIRREGGGCFICL